MRPIKHCQCGNICEGTTDACASCNSAARRNERASKKVQVVRQVQKVTAKRAQQNQEYLKLRAEYLALYPVCEVEDCHLKATEIHHMGTRTNENLLNTNLFLAVCHKHHGEITTDSKWAKDNGYSVPRTGDVEK